MERKKKTRLDLLLVEHGLAASRERAQGLILSGNVLVNDTPVLKPGTTVPVDAVIRIRGVEHPYVSRGGIKLEAALKEFGVFVSDRVALDVGASTGGFTQVLLLNGARQVFAVDVGHNQLDWKIRSDPRVVVFEKVNARHLKFEQIGQLVDLIVIDVSFISLDKLLAPLCKFAQPNTDWITLIKPQFEVGKGKVGKGGIVQTEELRLEAVERVTEFAKTIGLIRRGLVTSPIAGTEGNIEYLAHWKLE